MRVLSILAVIFLSACATVAGLQLDERFGKPDPKIDIIFSKR